MPLTPPLPHPTHHKGASLLLAACLTSAPIGLPQAQSAFGWANCTSTPTAPGCDVGARGPATGARTNNAKDNGSDTGADGGTGTRTCRDLRGATAPCHDPDLGWLAADGCYYRPTTTPSADLQATLDIKAGPGEGGWYEYVCPGLRGTGGGVRWVPGPPPGPSRVDPAVLARQAVSRLDLPSPRLGMSPAATQMVTVPTWLWIDTPSWQPRTATAQAPGVSVTATARPSRVAWTLGDGTTVTCAGPGTAWTPGTDPAASSPTCGHTYRRSSAGMPGGTFPVTATLSWTVSWTVTSSDGGPGDRTPGGTVPDLSTTSTTAVHVADMPTVVSR